MPIFTSSPVTLYLSSLTLLYILIYSIMKKNSIIIIGAVICLIVVFVLLYFFRDEPSTQTPLLNDIQPQSVAPVLMTAEEKNSLFIPVDKEVQVLRRNADGEIMTYKIIESQDQIINNGSLFPSNSSELK